VIAAVVGLVGFVVWWAVYFAVVLYVSKDRRISVLIATLVAASWLVVVALDTDPP
jgi:hypothetical protein